MLWALALFFTAYCITRPALASQSVKKALDMCAHGIIPSLFPFTAAVSIINNSGLSDSAARIIGRPIGIIFGIPRTAASAMLLGIVGGFPIGAICVRELYKSGTITKDDAERLLGLTGCAGPAFCISAVGMTFFESTAFGGVLYISQIISVFIISLFGRSKSRRITHLHLLKKSESVSHIIAKSISDSGTTMLKVCSFAVFFSVLGDVICAVFESRLGSLFCTVSMAVTELSSAAVHCAELGGTLGKLLCAFAVGFSGMSVHMQISSVISDCDLNMKRYYVTKLASGLVCFALMLVYLQISSLFSVYG